MAGILTLQNADGTTASPMDFGLVLPGATSATTTRKIKNTGDAPLLNVTVWLDQTDVLDGELHGTIGATTLTDTPLIVSASLAANAELVVTLWWTTPVGATPVPADTGILQVEASA